MEIKYCFLLFLLKELTFKSNADCGCRTNRENRKVLSFIDRNLGVDVNQCENETLNDERNLVLIPSGEYQMGTDDIILPADREGPSKFVKVDRFLIDKFEVSNEDFRLFVEETQYKTEAEFFGDSFVFEMFLNDSVKESLKDYRAVQAVWWYKVSGANWNHPTGTDSNILDIMNHPVVHVSWNDAKAFCKWRGARLPTEAEWEAACRGGHKGTLYPWGDELYPNRTHMANIWQGKFPKTNTAKDGYVGTAPVTTFPQNDFGLHNIAGNVWEWTEDAWSVENTLESTYQWSWHEPAAARYARFVHVVHSHPNRSSLRSSQPTAELIMNPNIHPCMYKVQQALMFDILYLGIVSLVNLILGIER